MQTLDRIPAASVTGNDVEPPPENNYGQSSPDDFSRMMQQALATNEKDSPREDALRVEKKRAAVENDSAQPENSSLDSVNKKISGKDSKTDSSSESKKTKTSTDQNSKTSDGNNLPLVDFNIAAPLPLPVVVISAESKTEVSASAKNALTAETVAAIDGAAGVTSVAAAGFKSEKVAVEKSKALATELASMKPDVASTSQKTDVVQAETATAAADLLKNAAVLADKNPPATEISKTALVAEAAQKSSELAAAVLSAHATEKNGMGVATLDLPMKKNANTNKVAGLDGKVLPGDASLTSLEKVLPVQTVAGPVRSAENNLSDNNINLTLPGTVSAADFSTSQGTMILPGLTDARLRNLERTHDMVALHAVRLVQAQTDALQVVIKPGAGTELSLELRQRNGGIEAHAVLSRGDFQLMNQHWPELQQRLEQRGIKLAALGGETNFSTDSDSNFKQQQQSSREMEAQKASAFAEFALAGRALGATARLAVSGGGWESWA